MFFFLFNYLRLFLFLVFLYVNLLKKLKIHKYNHRLKKFLVLIKKIDKKILEKIVKLETLAKSYEFHIIFLKN